MIFDAWKPSLEATDRPNVFVSILKRLVMYFRREYCQHEFKLCDLSKTNIEPLKKPDGNDYFEWKEYYRAEGVHDSVTKRVQWSCHKCGKIFYAHCGLDISPKHGFVVSDT